MKTLKGAMGQLQVRSSLENAIRVLEVFSTKSRLSFDRMLATRILDEAERAIPGEDSQAWFRRLVEVGESLNLRTSSIDCSLNDVLALVRQGIPVATGVSTPDGRLQWFLLVEAKVWRVKLAAMEPTQRDRWVWISSLQRSLGLESRSATTRWVIGEPALGCAHDPEPHRHDSGPGAHQPIAPPLAWERLIKLLQPERGDIGAIIVFSLVVGLLTLATPIAVEALVNTVAFGRYLQPVVVLALLLFTFLGFAALIRALLAYIVEIVQRRLFVRVVADLAYRLPRVQQTAVDHYYGPTLVNHFFDVVTVQKVASMLLLDGIAIALQTLIGMLVLAFYHPFLLGFDLMLLALMAFAIFVLGRGAIRSSIDESKAKYALAGWLEELLRFPTVFKLHGGSQFGLDRADHLAIDWLQARRSHFRIVFRQILFAFGLQAVAATTLLGLGGWLVIRGQLTLGQLVAAELIVMLIVSSFAKIGKHMENFYDLMAAMEKLGKLFDLPIEPHDKLFHLRGGFPARVAVRQVSYRYDHEEVLRDVDFEIEPGEVVALVGPPGSGKSTLVDILCGLRQPLHGHVELDGIDLRELRPDSLREHMALTRLPEIFQGTIDENVHLNRPNISALDVRRAISAVGLLDEILKLPDGLNTWVQTQGAPLTTIQAVRLMLARAIVDRPRLLLIDGTLDLLPDGLIATVMSSLHEPNGPWTVLIVTGRQRVMDACDRVIRLEQADAAADEHAVTSRA